MIKQQDETLFHYRFVNGMEPDESSYLLECPACLESALPFPGGLERLSKEKAFSCKVI
jgi:hypothetical protein